MKIKRLRKFGANKAIFNTTTRSNSKVMTLSSDSADPESRLHQPWHVSTELWWILKKEKTASNPTISRGS